MAANKILFLALMFWCVLRTASAIDGEGRSTVTPPNLVLALNASDEGGSVTVKCEVINLNDGAGEQLNLIWITRMVDGSTDSDVILADYGNGRLPSSLSDTTASGSIDDEQLTLIMAKTKCADAGNYTCHVTIINPVTGDSPKTDSKTSALRVSVSPGDILLTADPDFSAHTVNDSLTLKCNGAVGSVNDGISVSWVWQKNISATQWQTVGSDQAYIRDVGDPIQEDCYERRQSWLTLNLTTADTYQAYRCLVRRGNRDYTEFAATYTVGPVTETPVTTTQSSGDGNADKGSIGGIIGGVIGALVVVIVIIVIIVFVVRRRKAKAGDDYAADDPGNKPADDPNGPPITTGPGVVYSQPNRFRNDREPRGVANEGMTAEKPSPRDHRDTRDPHDNAHHPPRYANDFHQGRPNRGFSYEPDGGRRGDRDQRQRHSSDEDGTDSRVNTSQQSIGLGDPSIGTPI